MVLFTRPLTFVVALFALVASVLATFDTNTWPVILAPDATSISYGQTVPIDLGMNSAGSSSTTVYLSSSHPDLIPVPSSVTVPSQSSTARFNTMEPAIGQPPSSPVQVTLTATANGHSAQTVVTVN